MALPRKDNNLNNLDSSKSEGASKNGSSDDVLYDAFFGDDDNDDENIPFDVTSRTKPIQKPVQKPAQKQVKRENTPVKKDHFSAPKHEFVDNEEDLKRKRREQAESLREKGLSSGKALDSEFEDVDVVEAAKQRGELSKREQRRLERERKKAEKAKGKKNGGLFSSKKNKTVGQEQSSKDGDDDFLDAPIETSGTSKTGTFSSNGKKFEDLSKREQRRAVRNLKAHVKKYGTIQGIDDIELYINPDTNMLLPVFSDLKLPQNKQEFDKRRNLSMRAKAYQILFLCIFFAGIGLGIKGQFFPPEVKSDEEIVSIVKAAFRDTGFPVERGRAFARDFMQAYLEIGPNTSAQSAARALSFYYGLPENSLDTTAHNRSSPGGYIQTVISGPTVYNEYMLTESTAIFTIGAIVRTGEMSSDEEVYSSDPDKIMFFDVNVYYDKQSGSFAITPDSPSVTVPVEGFPQSSIPAAKPISNMPKINSPSEDLKNTIVEYIKGYAVASETDQSAIAQYLAPDATRVSKVGLNGKWELAGAASDSVRFEVYGNGEEFEAKTTVQWRSSVGSENKGVDITSVYIVSLRKDGEKHLITNFGPYVYIPEDS